MPQIKLKQLRLESDTWKRSLYFMRDENVHLKNSLAELLSNDFDTSLLEEIENFQTSFIKLDEMIGLLRNDVAKLDKLLVKEVIDDGQIPKDIHRTVKGFRRKIRIAEQKFGQLKLEFNSYLLENKY